MHVRAFAAVAFLALTSAAGAADPRGAQIFELTCAQCHLNAASRAPALTMLHLMSAGAIYRAMTTGAMQVQARTLTDNDKRTVAEFLGGKDVGGVSGTGAPACQGPSAAFDWHDGRAFAGWGVDLQNTRSIPAAVSGINPSNVSNLKLKWAMSFPDALRARSEPALAGGALFVGSQDGTVYALDLGTGCARWTFKAAAEIRTGVVVSAVEQGARPLVYVGDLIGNVYALEASSGALAWRDHTDSHPSVTLSATPVLQGGKLIVAVSSMEEANNDPHYECCTFSGSVIAYEARTGKRLWQTHMTDTPVTQHPSPEGTRRFGPSGAAIWGTPAIDEARQRIYVATGDNYSDPASRTSDAIVALNLTDGRIVWSWQALADDKWNAGCLPPAATTLCPNNPGRDSDFGAAPILTRSRTGRPLIIVGQKSGRVYAVDADSGQPVWQSQVGRGGIEGGVHFGMALENNRLFVPINDMTDIVYGLGTSKGAEPGVHALDVSSGKSLWQQPIDSSRCHDRPFCTGGISAAATATDGVLMTGAIDGWLRFYDSVSGRILWQYDTTQSVHTVGGGESRGGSMAGGAGPVAYHGTVIVASGYDFSRKMPGNLLLVFAVRSQSTR
jgi:polyvinyl alcohol dehydrogenase (cytochrome)